MVELNLNVGDFVKYKGNDAEIYQGHIDEIELDDTYIKYLIGFYWFGIENIIEIISEDKRIIALRKLEYDDDEINDILNAIDSILKYI